MYHTYSPHYLFLATPSNVIDQPGIGMSEITDVDRERTIHSSIDVSHSTSAHVFVEYLTFEGHFKLNHGRSTRRPASVPNIRRTDM